MSLKHERGTTWNLSRRCCKRVKKKGLVKISIIWSRERTCFKSSCWKTFSQKKKMDIKLDMFCLSMKNQVVCKGNKAKIVTPKHWRVSNRNPEFLKKRLNPGEFSCYSSEALIFYLSWRARDSGLLICTPSNEVGTQKKRVTTSRFSIIGIGGPISIQRSH